MKTTAINKGQSLAEYTLIGGVIALVSIGGLMALTNSLGQQVNTMHGMFGGNATQQANAAQNNAAPGANAQAALPVATTAASPYPMTMAGYQQMLADMPMIIETTGASGATKQLMAYLSSLGDELLENEEITPEQNIMLQNLANAGHSIGVHQAAVENHFNTLAENTALSDLQWSTVNVNENEVVYDDLFFQLDWQGYGAHRSTSITDITEGMKNHEDYKAWQKGELGIEQLTQFSQFVAHYDLAKKSGVMGNTSVENIVNELSRLTLSNTDAFHYRLSAAHNPTSTVEQQILTVTDQMKSIANHARSKGICETGGGKDTGTFCSE